LAGTDPTGAGRVIAGYANIREIELLVEAGLSVPQAIQVSSLNGAKYLGKDTEIGTVAKGKIADLVLINGDLEADASNLRNIELVFKNGVGYNSKRMFDSVRGAVGIY